jgi:hypothetical protein
MLRHVSLTHEVGMHFIHPPKMLREKHAQCLRVVFLILSMADSYNLNDIRITA